MNYCIFCEISNHQQPADIVFEDEQMIVFKDIKPKAAVHFLIVPKKHIDSIEALKEEDKELVSQMIFLAKKMAQEQGVSQTGYKLLFNVLRGGGQLIDHIHLHLIGGEVRP
ncbi:MAG: histidine triad nucleotide-binding protein [Candidatus Portnoybacteria bacterium RIFCSPLOWO2_12_FULL_39_9]|uniref:Histidine triad nucleotide-binding protein n=1 Tax=Candidatus Portnoybacteria bacterium RIFCSPHIGHO2_12_FULL_38_9 TaxID=1801997 RepID=A0A1G2FHI1_9BACT|nr:MAG: histidine triad nucleotide-binding protein [Candidatus Portnoybacteria bacterium RBG_13_40_8]OGZ36629.1 MAG: histidine triad nucleotide-binding protein [Candidatus Portnoybacteria bacterium RIFCSPHIGHO2_02_FULL_39_12]OGZ37523.1 MAG: histidine triad nucleotide-binding protein [Candidatus Portnoybacteria bacterium RIFCSPHIGHO2_12_FULL_38_9]OGZ39357.1 MAG: histidine triad nucleotide-binding protein [Candidatus Portnoybacteria bacterium RIFCSPLOWO2_01_FULL_38_39]OGZ39863.1 MAG: histidine tr